MRPDQRARLGNALLVVGYPLAGAAGVKLVPAMRERRAARFALFESATAAVAMGFALRRRPAPAAVNAVALVALAGAWYATGRGR